MASERRIEKVSVLLREELAKILAREIEFPEGVLVTVTRITISTDMYYATAFVSLLGGDPQEAFTLLQKNMYAIQQMVNRRLRMRPIPKIHFALDEAEFNREQVERSLASLKKKKEI